MIEFIEQSLWSSPGQPKLRLLKIYIDKPSSPTTFELWAPQSWQLHLLVTLAFPTGVHPWIEIGGNGNSPDARHFHFDRCTYRFGLTLRSFNVPLHPRLWVNQLHLAAVSYTLCLLGIALLPRRKTGPPQSPNCLDHFRVAPSYMHRHSNKFILKGLFG
jgi:hypothetical protein